LRAEHVAMVSDNGLLGALADPARVSDEQVVGKTVLIGLDTQSLLSMMAKGPLLQKDALGIMMWQYTFAVLRRGAARVAFIFLFSHCGFSRNSYVDKLADGDAKKLAAGEDSAPVWRTDGARAIYNEVYKEQAKLLDANSPNDFTKALPRKLVKLNAKQSPADDKLLGQLRTGIVPRFGIYAHDDPPPCPICDEAGRMARGGVGMMHLFACQGQAAKAARDKVLLRSGKVKFVPEDLYRFPAAMLVYFRALLEKVEADATPPVVTNQPPPPPMVPGPQFNDVNGIGVMSVFPPSGNESSGPPVGAAATAAAVLGANHVGTAASSAQSGLLSHTSGAAAP
jgi:hypothetical protein